MKHVQTCIEIQYIINSLYNSNKLETQNMTTFMLQHSFLVISLSSVQAYFSLLLEEHSKLFLGCSLPFVLFSIKMITH